MHLDRRRFLQAATAVGAGLLLRPAAASVPGVPSDVPLTGFEQRGGASWTTHGEEIAFLAAVAARATPTAAQKVTVEVIGETLKGLPIHLVTLGKGGAKDPSALFLGSQHGNEPAGRETVLALLRDLAFTTDPVLQRQIADQSFLMVPSANPDGRAANTRGNGRGVDVNRDHLTLTEPESRAIAAVVRDVAPSVCLDLHEYGPGTPVLYDDEILYLWPRNLNVDAAVRDLSRTLAKEYIAKGARAAGYTADEYGLDKVGEIEVQQTAGDEDEGICRNLVGLRHSLGILVESAVTMNATNGPAELTSTAAVQLRRVASQRQVTVDTLRFLREQGEVARFVTAGAPARKTQEGREQSAPVYVGGADNRPATSAEQLPAPAGYRLTAEQVSALGPVLDLHGIRTEPVGGGAVTVSMAQPAEPVIPLLLDARADRNLVDGTAY